MVDDKQHTPCLAVRGLDKQFADERVLAGVDLELADGETLAILGRSGSGKTTLLKIIAGLESADSGQIRLRGQDIATWEPRRRGIVYLYQEPLLLPHLDLWENLAFGLRLRKVPTAEMKQRVEVLIDGLQLRGHERKAPHQLSGGQRQRVSFGRALIVRPNLLLLDEPFGNLDVGIRADMQQLFKGLAAAFQMPALFVTHDLKEALLMGDRLAHMRRGQLQIFPDRQRFVDDPLVGVRDEIDFWQTLGRDHEHP